jgi:drug/metabolite transporter (DMT)-like permease
MQMLTAGALMGVLGIALGELGQLQVPSAASLLALAYLVVVGSIVAFSAYVWLLHQAPAPLVSTYAFVNPVVAVLLGAVFLAEPVGETTIVAGVAIVAAVALIVTSRPRRGPVVVEEAPVPGDARLERAA